MTTPEIEISQQLLVTSPLSSVGGRMKNVLATVAKTSEKF